MNIRAKMIPALAAVGLFALCAQSMAASPELDKGTPTVNRTVRFGDLDVTTPEGRKILEGRVRVAVSQVCREIAPTTEGRASNLKCNSSLIQNTLAKVFERDGKTLAKRNQITIQKVADARTP